MGPVGPVVRPGATPSPGLGREDLALFGAACCNRLAEQQRSDWRQSAHWCALARQFEGAVGLGLAWDWRCVEWVILSRRLL